MQDEVVDVVFEGGMRVGARIGEHVVMTDQTGDKGGEDTAPNPFQLFFAAIATCSGIYAKRFCESRKIDTTGLGMTLRATYDEEAKRMRTVTLELTLPPAFPEKYHGAIRRAVDLCTVKKHILTPPEFELVVKPT